MRVSIRQMSEMTGYSQATISNALNNKPGVNKATAHKILQVAREHGYNAEAKISKIRFIMFSAGGQIVMDTPFFSSLIQGIESECREKGYELTISRIDKSDINNEKSNTLQLLLNDNTCAILLLATEMTEDDARCFAGAKAPIVILDSWFPKLSYNSVMINNADSVYYAVDWLITKGHSKIGYLYGSMRIQNFLYREEGYRLALFKHGLKTNPSYEFSLSPTMDGAYDDMCNVLKNDPDMPTAFFADNDIIALGAMKALQEYGYKIPDDVSIVGFDDMPFCSISTPSLTTVQVYKQEMGRVAVRRLIEITKQNNNFFTKIQICNGFAERDSVCDNTI